MDLALIETAARQLRDAASSGVACGPVRDVLGTDSDTDAAYAVQQHNLEQDLAAGRRVSGHKIGLTSEAVQRQFGVSRPDCGTLLADTCLSDGAGIGPGRLLQPRAEAEIAVVLGRDLDRGRHCVTDVIEAVAYLLPALEIADSRVAGWDITIVDTVADNASSGLYVVGSRPVSLSALDVRAVEMSLSINGKVAATGRGSACLGNPLNAVVWLADVMGRRGSPLRAGHCIMTGSLGPMVPIAAGDDVSADMGPLGTVSTRLIEE